MQFATLGQEWCLASEGLLGFPSSQPVSCGRKEWCWWLSHWKDDHLIPLELRWRHQKELLEKRPLELALIDGITGELPRYYRDHFLPHFPILSKE